VYVRKYLWLVDQAQLAVLSDNKTVLISLAVIIFSIIDMITVA